MLLVDPEGIVVSRQRISKFDCKATEEGVCLTQGTFVTVTTHI